MTHQTRFLKLIVAALVVLSAGVLAKGKPAADAGTPATATFDDLSGDAIQSDGLGAYDATIDGGVITLSTGRKRAVFFDFSDCLPDSDSCDGPFGSSSSDEVSSTLTIDLDMGTARFEFSGAGGEYLLHAEVAITGFDDDEDGVIDRYGIETEGGAGHGLFRLDKKGGRGSEPGSSRYLLVGSFSMPWGIEVVVD